MLAFSRRSFRIFVVTTAIAAVSATFPIAGQSAMSPTESGRVLDIDSGLPVAGATVVVSRTLIGDANDATQISTTAVTADDGSYTVANVPPGPMNVQVFPKDGYPALHRGVRVGAGVNDGSVTIAKTTAAENAWLKRINRERAAYGLKPVVFDQSAIASARYWAGYMAHHHYFDHALPNANPNASAPGDDTPVTRYLKFSGLDIDQTNGMSENIAEVDGSQSWSEAEDLFMDERSKCPNGQPVGCAFSEETGHFLNILNPDFKWVGLGISKVGDQTYYDQEFIVGA